MACLCDLEGHLQSWMKPTHQYTQKSQGWVLRFSSSGGMFVLEQYPERLARKFGFSIQTGKYHPVGSNGLPSIETRGYDTLVEALELELRPLYETKDAAGKTIQALPGGYRIPHCLEDWKKTFEKFKATEQKESHRGNAYSVYDANLTMTPVGPQYVPIGVLNKRLNELEDMISFLATEMQALAASKGQPEQGEVSIEISEGKDSQ
jgi:hypothetical protein